MPFGLTRGEIILIAFVFALVYTAGLLPRITKALSPKTKETPPAD